MKFDTFEKALYIVSEKKKCDQELLKLEGYRADLMYNLMDLPKGVDITSEIDNLFHSLKARLRTKVDELDLDFQRLQDSTI